MALINSVVSWLMKKRFHQIELFMKFPHEVQFEIFRKLVQSAEETEWGMKYGYADIKKEADFKKQVPLNDYNSLRPYIERNMKGEQNLLWNTEIRWFAKSSGTTSDKSKFIPISQEALEDCHYKGGKDMLSIYCINFPDTAMFDGRGIAMGGSHNIHEVNNEEYLVGDLSAIIIENLPSWAEFQRVPKRSVALMNEWEEKIEVMAQTTIPHNVTSLSGVPSWTLLLLRRVLEITGEKYISDVWPNMEVFFHGGVNFTPYRQQFQELIPSQKMYYIDTYNASEGFFAIQDTPDSDDMLLMLDYGIYYEFLPMSEFDLENRNTVGLEDVELGKNYALIISTNGGLWRYVIGDTVKFTSKDPYRIKITGRTKAFINAFGEELIVDNADKAITTACLKCNAHVSDYTAAPIYFGNSSNGSHEWLIEFEKAPDNLSFFTETLDNALKSLNSDYEAKRYQNMILHEPIVKALPKGTFYKWMKMRGKLGGQNKVPRLSNDRKHVEEILELI